MSYLPPVQAMVETIRRNSRAPLVLGGSGVSLMPEAVLRHLQADFVVVGEGEKTLVSLLGCVQAGGDPATIRGVGMMKDGCFHLVPAQHDAMSPESPDLGRWIDTAPYHRLGGSYNVQTKRGFRRIYEAAAGSPSLYLGLDEDILEISRLVAFACRMLRARRPYWRYFPLRNVLAMKSGLRLAPRPRDLADQIRSALRHCGQPGPSCFFVGTRDHEL